MKNEGGAGTSAWPTGPNLLHAIYLAPVAAVPPSNPAKETRALHLPQKQAPRRYSKNMITMIPTAQ